MVPSFSWRPGITEPIFILSPLQGCNRTQKSCSYLDNNERTENNEDKWSSHKAESLPSPWLLILTSLNMYDYWHSWSLVSWCFHGYHNILSFGIHHECCCKLFCGSPQPCLTYFAVVVFDRRCQVGILNRICGGSAQPSSSKNTCIKKWNLCCWDEKPQIRTLQHSLWPIVEARTIAEFFSSQICCACPGSFSNAMAELKSPV